MNRCNGQVASASSRRMSAASWAASQAVSSARDLAWQNALVLWELRGDAVARALFLDGLAAATALASRLLLTAV